MSRQLVVIDPASHTPEVDTFNLIARLSPISATYHLPQLLGMATLEAEEDPAGLIILGSAASVPDLPPWQVALEKWARPRWEAGVPTLAICWGHQWIAHLYGGRVKFWNERKEKLQGFREVEFRDNRLTTAKGELFVSHREIVSEPPQGFRTIAWSALDHVEAMEHGTLPLWSVQAHPEATVEFAKNQKTSPLPPAERFAFGHSLIRAFVGKIGRSR